MSHAYISKENMVHKPKLQKSMVSAEESNLNQKDIKNNFEVNSNIQLFNSI